MIRLLKDLLNRFILMTRYRVICLDRTEIRKWLPVATLSPLDLVLTGHDARNETITILQIGACDAAVDDPVRFLVEKGSTHSTLVEPNPFAFARLQKTYAGIPNVTFIQAAIGEKDGEATLYRVKPPEKMNSGIVPHIQVASFYREHLLFHSVNPDDIERITVPCRTLASLVKELGLTKIDLLQIDAEGFDAPIVRMAMELPELPACINFEHRHLATQDRLPLFDLLKTKNYLLSYDDWNILALQESVLQEWKSRPNKSELQGNGTRK